MANNKRGFELDGLDLVLIMSMLLVFVRVAFDPSVTESWLHDVVSYILEIIYGDYTNRS